MNIRVRRLTEGYIVSDGTGWEVAAVTETEALNRAELRAYPNRIPTPPPGRPVHPLTQRQFEQATGDAPCVGAMCSAD